MSRVRGRGRCIGLRVRAILVGVRWCLQKGLGVSAWFCDHPHLVVSVRYVGTEPMTALQSM